MVAHPFRDDLILEESSDKTSEIATKGNVDENVVEAVAIETEESS